MNIDQISPSILHVTAKENLNIEQDLSKESDKTIAQLLNEKTEKKTETETETEKSNG